VKKKKNFESTQDKGKNVSFNARQERQVKRPKEQPATKSALPPSGGKRPKKKPLPNIIPVKSRKEVNQKKSIKGGYMTAQCADVEQRVGGQLKPGENSPVWATPEGNHDQPANRSLLDFLVGKKPPHKREAKKTGLKIKKKHQRTPGPQGEKRVSARNHTWITLPRGGPRGGFNQKTNRLTVSRSPRQQGKNRQFGPGTEPGDSKKNQKNGVVGKR